MKKRILCFMTAAVLILLPWNARQNYVKTGTPILRIIMSSARGNPRKPNRAIPGISIAPSAKP